MDVKPNPRTQLPITRWSWIVIRPAAGLVLQELIGQLVFAYCHLGTAVLLGHCENHLQGRIFNIASISVS